MRVIQIGSLCLVVCALMVSPGLAENGEFDSPRTALSIPAANVGDHPSLVSTGFEFRVDPRISAFLTLSEVWEISYVDFGCPCCPVAGPALSLRLEDAGGCCIPCFQQDAGGQ